MNFLCIYFSLLVNLRNSTQKYFSIDSVSAVIIQGRRYTQPYDMQENIAHNIIVIFHATP